MQTFKFGTQYDDYVYIFKEDILVKFADQYVRGRNYILFNYPAINCIEFLYKPFVLSKIVTVLEVHSLWAELMDISCGAQNC